MTEFWPMEGSFQEVNLKGPNVSASSLSPRSAGWNGDTMAGAVAAILDVGAVTGQKGGRSLTPRSLTGPFLGHLTLVST